MKALVGLGTAVAVAALTLTLAVAGASRAVGVLHGTSSAAAKRPPLLAQTPESPLTIPDTVTISGSPSTVAADSDGTVYVGVGQQGSGSNSDIAEFDPQGTFVRVFGAHLDGGNPLLAVGPDHNVYAWANSTFEPIREYSPAGALLRTIAIPATIVRLTDLELDGAGDIYATGYDNDGSSWKVFRFDSSGHETAAFAVGPAGDTLYSLAVDPDGTLWVVRQAGDVSILTHVDAAGRDLENAPYLGVLDGGSLVRDIDYADGRLYAIGYGDPTLGAPDVRSRVVLSTFTPSGFLVAKVIGAQLPGYCCPDDRYSVAVQGSHVWATGLDASKLSAGRRFLESRPQVATLGSSSVVKASDGSYATGGCGSGNSYTPTGPPVGTLEIPDAGHTGCHIAFANDGNPCAAGNKAHPVALFQNGNIISKSIDGPDEEDYTVFWVDPFAYGSGPIYAGWICTNPNTHTSAVVYELKGDIELYDPSGVVVDARSNRRVGGATVVLQVSPGGHARYGAPSFGDIRPQANPELTGSDGSFGWDVAPGSWRVKVVAFGYRPYISAAYTVPPPVTGLRLKLQADSAQQHYLIDPNGRVGAVALGMTPRRVAGLRIRAARNRVRMITVVSNRYRTELGIRLGSGKSAVDHAYPLAALKTLKGKAKKTLSYRVGRATFTIRRGRVVAIVVGR